MGQGSPDARATEQRPGWGIQPGLGYQHLDIGPGRDPRCDRCQNMTRQVLSPTPRDHGGDVRVGDMLASPCMGLWRGWDANPSPHGTMVGLCPQGRTLALSHFPGSGFTLRH